MSTAARELRRLLSRTWGTFFGRFDRLTPIQEQGMAPILAGQDALLVAPTASGKTEAYVAPLVERLLGGGRAPFSLLIVSPTRALANDLHRRLAVRMDAVGVDFGRHTGEHKDRAAGRVPEVVIATPEALDALLARRPAVLASLAAVALDELHVLDGTPRGDQLRVLLHRLDQAAERRPQRVAASATVAEPAALAARYLRDAAVVEAGRSRPLRAAAFAGTHPLEVARHLDVLAAHGRRKVLLFCNARRDVELYAAELRGRTRFGDAVYAHHGSLAQATREGTERRFLAADAGVAVATLTLELGIDIGSVDTVLLLAPPSSVASLLQRVGRGSRRSGETRVAYAADGDAERHLYRFLLAKAAAGELLEEPYAFRPSVLVQQALVIAGGKGSVTAGALRAAVPEDLARGLPEDASGRILDAMAEKGLFEPPRGGHYVLAAGPESRYEAGRLHGNLDPDSSMQVVDRLTGDVVGSVAPWATERAGSLQLAGRGRRTIRASDGRLLTDTRGRAASATFTPRRVPAMGQRLARALVESLGVPPGVVLQTRLGDEVLLLHGLGASGVLLLRALIEPRLGRSLAGRATPLTLRLPAPLDALPRPTETDVARLVVTHEKSLARLVGMGPYQAVLPPDLRRAAVRAASHLDDAAAFLSAARLDGELLTEAPGFWGGL